MNAEQIFEVIMRREFDATDYSELDDVMLFRSDDFSQAIKKAAAAITKKLAEKTTTEPPEPPKTVLPDMSDAEARKSYWFFAEDGTQVEYRRDFDSNDIPWRTNSSGWLPPEEFISQFPHLGRLREAIPGGLA